MGLFDAYDEQYTGVIPEPDEEIPGVSAAKEGGLFSGLEGPDPKPVSKTKTEGLFSQFEAPEPVPARKPVVGPTFPQRIISAASNLTGIAAPFVEAQIGAVTGVEPYSKAGPEDFQFKKPLYEGYKQSMRSVARGLQSITKQRGVIPKIEEYDLDDPISRGDYAADLMAARRAGVGPKQVSNILGNIGKADNLQADEEYMRALENKKGATKYFEQVVMMAPQMANQVAAHMLTGGIGSGIYMALEIAGGEYDQLLKEGVDEKRAASAAWGSAMMQAPMEAFSLGLIMRNPILRKLAINRAAKWGLSRLFGAGTEFITETAQNIPSEMWQQWAKDPDFLEKMKDPEALSKLLTKAIKEGTAEGKVAAFYGAIFGMSPKAARKPDGSKDLLTGKDVEPTPESVETRADANQILESAASNVEAAEEENLKAAGVIPVDSSLDDPITAEMAAHIDEVERRELVGREVAGAVERVEQEDMLAREAGVAPRMAAQVEDETEATTYPRTHAPQVATKQAPAISLRKEEVTRPLDVDTDVLTAREEVRAPAKKMFRSPAIQYEGEVFEGDSHMQLLVDNDRLSKIVSGKGFDISKYSDGFVKHDGTFVPRKEATQMVRKKGSEPLYSEDFMDKGLAKEDIADLPLAELDKIPMRDRARYIAGPDATDAEIDRLVSDAEAVIARAETYPTVKTRKDIEAMGTAMPVPTDAQIAAGNYKKARFTWKGMKSAIENPKGTVRKGVDKDGKNWSVELRHDYGEFPGIKGADGDEIDAFFGPDLGSDDLYIIDQHNPKTGKFDEHKVMAGFSGEGAARAGYMANYQSGWKGFGNITKMTVAGFKNFSKRMDPRKSISDQLLITRDEWLEHPEYRTGMYSKLKYKPEATGKMAIATNLTIDKEYDIWAKRQGIEIDESVAYTKATIKRIRPYIDVSKIKKVDLADKGQLAKKGMLIEGSAIKLMSEYFELPVTVFDAKSQKLGINGFYAPGRKAIFINKDSSNPMLSLFGHESLHLMKVEHYDLYKDLVRYLDVKIKSDGYLSFVNEYTNTIIGVSKYVATKKHGEAYTEAQFEAIFKNQRIADAQIREEYIAHLVGNAFVNKNFWDQLASKEKGLFDRLAKFVLGLINHMKSFGIKAKYEGKIDFVDNIDEVSRIIAEAYYEMKGERSFAKEVKEYASPGVSYDIEGERSSFEALEAEASKADPPKKTIKAYKLFRTLKTRPGELFPLFIGKSEPVKQGEWIDAKFIPTVGFSQRPGWHSGIQPMAPHLMKKDGTMQVDRVWAEIEVPADKDWQKVADKQKTKDIKGEVPVGGHYQFARPQQQGDGWIISGAIKVNKVLSQEEVDRINLEADEGKVERLITKPEKDFAKKLRSDVSERVAETQKKAAAYTGWMWDVGDRVRSKKLGKVYEITGRTWDNKNDRAMYIYKGLDSDMESGMFIAELAHDSLIGLYGPLRVADDVVLDIDTEGASFKKWFGKSKIKNKDGSPMVVYHGTTAAKPFKHLAPGPDDIGIHFGTAGQATDRLDYLSFMRDRYPDLIKRKPGADRIIPAYLKIEKPITITSDPGSWGPSNFFFVLNEHSDAKFTKQEMESLEGISDDYMTDPEADLKEAHDAFLLTFLEFAEHHGYDGIIYLNDGEITGSLELRNRIEAEEDVDKKEGLDRQLRKLQKEGKENSYIIFDDSQMKSSLTDKEEMMFDIEPGDTVWHGGPYKFKRFESEKIGTGEGHQAFGWGLYFSELKGIARHYAKALVEGRKENVTIDGVAYNAGSLLDGKYPLIADYVGWSELFLQTEDSIKFGKEETINNLNDFIKTLSGNEKRGWTQLKNMIRDDRVGIEGARNLYAATVKPKGEKYKWLSWYDQVDKDNLGPIIDEITKSEAARDYLSSGELINLVHEQPGKPNNAALYRVLTNIKGSKKGASRLLLEAGYDGIVYPAETLSGKVMASKERGEVYEALKESGSFQTPSDFIDRAVEERDLPDIGADRPATSVVTSTLKRLGKLGLLDKYFKALDDAPKNYVVFNATDIQVEEHIMFDMSDEKLKKTRKKKIPLQKAVDDGIISKDEAAVISGVHSTFPKAWQDHFKVKVSKKKGKTGSELITSKIGPLKEDARHVAALYKGSSVDSFFYEFGNFAFMRLLGPVQSREFKTVSTAYKKAKADFKKVTENKRKAFVGQQEWFAGGFRDWWLRNLDGKEAPGKVDNKLIDIFRRVMAAVKGVWDRLKAAGNSHPLDDLYNDIITNGRDLNKKYYFSSKEMVLRYIIGADASEEQLKTQGFAANGKTFISWDPGTVCPKKRNLLEYVAKMLTDGKLGDIRDIDAKNAIWGQLLNPDFWISSYDMARKDGVDIPCSYCYVEQARQVAVSAFNLDKGIEGIVAAKAKPVYETTPYIDKVAKWSQKKIDDINQRGGLRMFSFSDYVRDWHYDQVRNLLRDCRKRGLAVKAITKNPQFVEDFARTGITINVSIDDGVVGQNGGMPWAKAAELKKQYKNVKVRTVAMRLHDAKLAGQVIRGYSYWAKLEFEGIKHFVDVITPYHHDDYTKPAPLGVESKKGFAFRVSPGGIGRPPKGTITGADGVSQALVDWIEKNPRQKGEIRTCCMVGGKCFKPEHQKQCGTNCGGIAGTLTIPEDNIPDDMFDVDSDAFVAWFGDSRVSDPDGKPKTVFHGTTHTGIDIFDTKGGGEREVGFLGNGAYFTDSIDDANANYAGMGPDLANRIDQEKAEIVEGMTEDVWQLREDIKEFMEDNRGIAEEISKKYNLENDDDVVMAFEDHYDAILTYVAKRGIVGESDGLVMPAYLKMEKPLYLDGDEIEFLIEYTTDDEGDIEEEFGNGIEFLQTFESVASGYTYNEEIFNEIKGEIGESLIEGASPSDIYRILEKHQDSFSNPDWGGLIPAGAIMREVAEELGYDGIIMDAGKHFGPRKIGYGTTVGMEGVVGAYHYMPFKPTQIKSSIGNRGTYDPNDPNIAFDIDPPKKETRKVLADKIGRKSKPTLEKVGEAVDDFRDNWKTRMMDAMNPIKEWFGEAGAYILHRGLPGVQSTLNGLMEHGKLKMLDDGSITTDGNQDGFLPWLKGLGVDAEKFMYWQIAMRSKALAKEGREALLTDADRKKIFDWVGEKPKNRESWMAISKEFGDWNQSVLNLAIKSGLITKEQTKSWMTDFYIPFYRIFEDEETRMEFVKGPPKGKKYISAQIKRLRGSDKRMGDPMENVIRNWSSLVANSMANRARLEAFNYASKNNIMSGEIRVNEETGEEEDVPLLETVQWKDTVTFKSQGKGMTFVQEKTGVPILAYRDGGKSVFFKVNDPELFNALSTMNNKYFDNVLMSVMTGAKRLLTLGATITPAFRIANMLRDTLHTFQISDNFLPFWDTARGFMKIWKNDPLYAKFMSSGHAFGGSYIRADDPASMKKYIDMVVKSEGTSARNFILDTPARLWKFWEAIGEASENAARVQLYANLLKKGGTHMEAAFSARDLMDFQMSGASSVLQFFVQTVPFLNARIQGLYKMGRSLHKNPKAFLAKGAMIAMASLALWYLYSDDDRYKELEDWEKWAYYHFWIGNKHIRIPKPFETGVIFSSSVEAAANVMKGNNEIDHVWNYVGHAALETFAFNPVPQLVRPVLEVYMDKSMFTGRAIEGPRLKRLEPGQRYDPWDSESLRVLGDALNISPKKAMALVRGYTASLGVGILKGSDYFVRNIADFPERPAMSIDEMPGLGRFIKEGEVNRYTRYISEFYQLYEEVDQLTGTVNNYRRIGEFDKAKKLSTANRKKLAMRKTLGKVRKKLGDISTELRKTWYSKSLDADQKYQKIQDLTKQRNQIVKQVYDDYQSRKDN